MTCKTRALVALLTAVHLQESGFAQSSWHEISVERARILLESLQENPTDAVLRVQYVIENHVGRGNRTIRDDRRRWYLAGTVGGWCSRKDVLDSKNNMELCTIWKDDMTYTVSMQKDRYVSELHKHSIEFDTLCPVQVALRPIGGLGWDRVLVSYPPMLAECSDEKDLVVYVPIQADMREAILAGRPVSGFICYRAQFSRINEKYRLVRIDRLGTTKVYQNGSWSDCPQIRKNTPRSHLLGLVEVGNLGSMSFNKYVKVGELSLPTELVFERADTTVTVGMEDNSLSVLGDDSTFDRFSAPSEFGQRGMFIDRVSDKTRYYGEETMSPEKALNSMLLGRNEKRNRDDGPTLAMIIAGILCVAMLALLCRRIWVAR